MIGESESIFRLAGNASSHVGLYRSHNEDNFFFDGYINENSLPIAELSSDFQIISNYWHCFAVFDGIGGGEHGELASLLAAQKFRSTLSNQSLHKSNVDQTAKLAFLDANREIVMQNKLSLFGTTGTAVFTDGYQFKVFSLGDSRAYLFRNHELFQLTRDQTLATIKMELGIYNMNDPQIERDKHVLTEFIGKDTTLDGIRPTESQWYDFLHEDYLLLCSDGLYDMCTETEIQTIFSRHQSPATITKVLINSAMQSGGSDNITCIVLEKVRTFG